MIATTLGINAPSQDTVKAQFAAAAKQQGGIAVNWSDGPHAVVQGTAADTAAATQSVLKQNGLEPTLVGGGFSSPKALADAIASTDQPVMFNVGGSGTNEHSITAQSDGQGNFSVNNLHSDGTTLTFTPQEFESGTLQATTEHKGVRSTSFPKIRYNAPVISGGKR